MGAETIERLTDELLRFRTQSKTPLGGSFVLTELVFAHDCGPDNSDDIIRQLATKHDFVRAVWLSRNFGQHAATLAGMASTSADWIITMDEDGQHDPDSIGVMLDQAVASHSQVVYGAPAQSTAHGRMRNLTSGGAKRVASLLSGSNMPLLFSSYRIISGEIGRSLAAYAGPSVYLDVALSWIVNRATVVDVNYREERRPNSGYSYRSLLGHFWKLALTTGTRPLRYVSVGGGVISLFGIALAIRIVIDKIYFGISATGWASVVVAVMTLGGFTLLALGIIAEYVGLIVRSTFGQPTYLAIRDPKKSPVHGIGSGPQGQ
jgi:undecaprenyl-phosphate 4-deoxy-4-formamido-L-arabinose transferase